MKTKTCVIGLKHKGRVYMGADSKVSGEWLYFSSPESKIIRYQDPEPMLLGISGECRIPQILDHCFTPPRRPKNCTDLQYLCKTFMQSVRKAMRQAGALEKTDGVESMVLFSGLLAYRKKLYFFDADMSILEPSGNVAAVGSGQPYALGAMEAMTTKDPKKKILRALEIAGKYDPYVGPPYYVEVL